MEQGTDLLDAFMHQLTAVTDTEEQSARSALPDDQDPSTRVSKKEPQVSHQDLQSLEEEETSKPNPTLGPIEWTLISSLSEKLFGQNGALIWGIPTTVRVISNSSLSL